MLSSSVLSSSHASNLLDDWDCSKCTIENYIGQDFELMKEDEFEIDGSGANYEYVASVERLAEEGSTYEPSVKLCAAGTCTSFEDDLPLYTYDKTEENIRAIYAYELRYDQMDDTLDYCNDEVYAVVEVVPMSPDSIEEVSGGGLIDTSFDAELAVYTIADDCVFDRMYLNCFCDPPAAYAGDSSDNANTTVTESDWQCCMEKETRVGAILCLLGIATA